MFPLPPGGLEDTSGQVHVNLDCRPRGAAAVQDCLRQPEFRRR